MAAPVISNRLLKVLKNIPETNADILASQNKVLNSIVGQISKCEFGKRMGVTAQERIEEFQNKPVTSYHDYILYIENIKDGKPNQLWPRLPLFMAETSGSTASKKYIPITQELLQNQLNGRRNALANVISIYGSSRILKSPPLSFGDAPVFNQYGKIKSAPISAILASQMPWWSKYFSRPSMATRKIPLFKDRIQSIYNEISQSPPGFIVAMPAWLRDFFFYTFYRTIANHH